MLIAGGVHWKLPDSFWKASIFSTVVIVAISLLTIFVFQSDYLGLDESASKNGSISDAILFVAALASFFGLLVSLMVGYFLKTIRPSSIKHNK